MRGFISKLDHLRRHTIYGSYIGQIVIGMLVFAKIKVNYSYFMDSGVISNKKWRIFRGERMLRGTTHYSMVFLYCLFNCIKFNLSYWTVK